MSLAPNGIRGLIFVALIAAIVLSLAAAIGSAALSLAGGRRCRS